MRKRRKTRYQWLLPSGTIGPAADVDDTSNGRAFVFNIPANGTTAVQIVDLLTDTPSEDVVIGATVLSMASSTQNEYFIRRIVGKLFAAADQNASGANAFLISAGIFVARAGDPSDFAGAENLPIGSATGATQAQNYSPLALDVIREPWIWRREWVLGNGAITASGVAAAAFPRTNADYGSIQDGPHIDAKTARRVKDGERLFAIIAGRNFPVNSTAAAQTLIQAYIDYRVLGQSRKSHNRSAF